MIRFVGGGGNVSFEFSFPFIYDYDYDYRNESLGLVIWKEESRGI